MSLFITFEGGEGSGKSYQARALYRRLQKLAVPAVLTHEPGVTELGKRITRWLKWGDKLKISPTAELMLFNASRGQLVEELIRPSLREGKVVICDRYYDSTTAYQSYGRGLDLVTVVYVNNAAAQGLVPNLTILLDTPVETGLGRKSDGRQDRFHQEKLAFHNRVREGYLKLAQCEPKRWLVINGTLPKNKISNLIWERVSSLLGKT